jgi:hypothetical protein
MSDHCGIDPAYAIGGDLIADTAEHNGKWRKILIVKDDTGFNTLEAKNIEGTFASTQFPSGFSFEAYITEIQLTSGSAVIAYRV